MKRVLCVLAAVAVSAANPPAVKKAEDVVAVSAKADKPDADGKQTVTVTLKLQKGWHVYANPVANKDFESNATSITVSNSAKPKTLATDYPEGKLVKDDAIGNYRVYEREVKVPVTLRRAAGDTAPLEVRVKVQACSDSTCLPPATLKAAVE